MLIFVSENKVITLKNGLDSFSTPPALRKGSSFEKVHGMGKDGGSGATKKANKKLYY